MMRKLAPWLALLLSTALLAGCGFHLRRDAQLPAGMHTVQLAVSGSADFRRAMERALVAADAEVVDAPGPDVASLRFSRAGFHTDNLTMSGQGRISEKSVSFEVDFEVLDAQGKLLVKPQSISLSRQFTYSPSEAIGQQSQVRVLQQSLVQDMVRAVMFRLEAAARQTQAPAG